MSRHLRDRAKPGRARPVEEYGATTERLPLRRGCAVTEPLFVALPPMPRSTTTYQRTLSLPLRSTRTLSIFQRKNGVSYLFAGSLEHLMRDLFTPSGRAFYQFGGFHDLRPIEPEAWADGLSERFGADNCVIDRAALHKIIQYGEGQPRTTMLIAQKTHLTSIELGVRAIDLNVVEQGLQAAMAGDRIAHEQIVERIRRSHRLGLLVAERVALGRAVYTGLPRGAVRRALEALRDDGTIESGGRGEWRITSPLLRRYLQSVQPGP